MKSNWAALCTGRAFLCCFAPRSSWQTSWILLNRCSLGKEGRCSLFLFLSFLSLSTFFLFLSFFLTFFSALSFLFLSFSVPPFFFTKPWMAIGHRPKSDTHVFREFNKEKEFLQRPIFLSSNTNRIQQLRVRVCEGIVKPASFPAADYDVQW